MPIVSVDLLLLIFFRVGCSNVAESNNGDVFIRFNKVSSLNLPTPLLFFPLKLL